MLWKISAGKFWMKRTSLDGSACLLAAILLLTLPLPWLLAAVIAAIFHELCHILALFFTGTRPLGLRIGISGAEIATPPLSTKSELLCAAAGPLGSLMLLLLIRYFPRIALCAAVQGLFNLLPVYPLDGGRILHAASKLLLPSKFAERFSLAVEKAVLLGFLLFSLYLSFCLQLGFLPMMFAAVMTTKALLRKIPCKEAKLGVQ